MKNWITVRIRRKAMIARVSLESEVSFEPETRFKYGVRFVSIVENWRVRRLRVAADPLTARLPANQRQ